MKSESSRREQGKTRDVEEKNMKDHELRFRARARPTFVPKRFPKDLVAQGLVLGDVLSSRHLLYFCVGVLSVTAKLVEGLGLHGFLNGEDVDGGHWVEARNAAARGNGHALVRYRRLR